jgi:hypothetical protein
MILYSVTGTHKRFQKKYRISVHFESHEQAQAYMSDIKNKQRQYKDLKVEESEVPHNNLDLTSWVNDLGNLIVDGSPTKYYYSKVG